jgi:hypothetical protein
VTADAGDVGEARHDHKGNAVEPQRQGRQLLEVSVINLPYSLRDLDFAAIRASADDAAMPVASERNLAGRWADVCAQALDRDEPVFEWLSASTLVGASPASCSRNQVMNEALARGRERGAEMPAPIYPAGSDRPHLHISYRDWFPRAAEVDAGQLHALAVCSPGRAVALAAEQPGCDASVAYDDADKLLSMRFDGHGLELDAEVLASLALMEGVFPEQAIAAALRTGQRRLARLSELIGHVEQRFGGRSSANAKATIAFEVDSAVIVDPLGQRYIDGEPWPLDYDRRFAAAMTNESDTPCTCDAPRQIRAILRPASELLSFGEGQRAAACSHRRISRDHCLIYELRCPHTSRRPSQADWEARSFPPDRLEEAWRQAALPTRVLAARSRSSGARAALAYSEEISAIITAPDLASRLALAIGFVHGEPLVGYSPNANLLFLTNERIDGDETALQRALQRGPLPAALEAEGLAAGPAVRMIAEFTILDVPPAATVVQRLATQPVRPGTLA